MNTKKLITIACVLIFTIGTTNAQNDEKSSNGSVENTWDELLTKYVTVDGLVDYKGFASEKQKLEKYIDFIKLNYPDDSWSDNEKMAYWINAYNTFTVWLILDNYPLKSIMKIKEKGKSAWDIKFIDIGGKIYSLNDIEHNILRKEFNDPRIHFGINCASYSCPKLLNTAIKANELDTRLDNLAKGFVNDSDRNNIKKDKIKISQLFKWFPEDFTKEGSLIDYLNKYSDIKIATDAKVEFLEYNWNLNENQE